eukprot:SAG31_NODE_8217_length_1494_cov_1.627240_3_plen_192_part_00
MVHKRAHIAGGQKIGRQKIWPRQRRSALIDPGRDSLFPKSEHLGLRYRKHRHAPPARRRPKLPHHLRRPEFKAGTPELLEIIGMLVSQIVVRNNAPSASAAPPTALSTKGSSEGCAATAAAAGLALSTFSPSSAHAVDITSRVSKPKNLRATVGGAERRATPTPRSAAAPSPRPRGGVAVAAKPKAPLLFL